MLVCGETGVGKTFRNILEIENYLRDNPRLARKGRKVLIFDVNDDDYECYLTVNPDFIRDLRLIRARRIRPLTKYGQVMSSTEKRDMVERMVKQFTDGLLVLEDLDKYMTGAKGQTIVSLLTTNRHHGLDIMISHQSIAKITTTEFQNCTWLRLHKQVDDVTRYRNRIPNYFLVRIATLIVEEQYLLGNIRFFVYVNMRKLKVRGCRVEAFIRACKKYLDTEENSMIRRMMLERDFYGKLIYKNRNEVVVKLIGELIRYHEQSYLSPISTEKPATAKAA
ncbi:MAG: hypothetical protein JST26_05630 [Bacteroidetes bacterium]|nr:hypothetical protein [Bacteroidota bacterium]